jgi:transposase
MYLDRQDFPLKNKKTYTRILLRESFREKGKVKKRTIANLSQMPPELVKAIERELKGKTKISKTVDASEIKTKIGISLGAVFTLHQLCKKLGIVKMLGKSRFAKLAEWMIISRLIEPKSKLATVRLANNHAACDVLAMEAFTEDDLYASLDWLSDNQDNFEKKLFKIRYGKAIPTLYLYDVTSSYLEGTKNAFARFGYSRDRKKGKMQIVIGLMTDDEGMSVSVSVFDGNTKDTKTFKHQIDKLSKEFGVKNVVMVGDRGMIKSQQIEDLGDDFYYITAITKPQIGTFLKENVIQTGLFDNDLCEVMNDGVRYILRKNPIREKEMSEVRNEKIDKIRDEIKVKNDYLQSHRKAHVEVAIKNTVARIEKLKISAFMGVVAEGRVLSQTINKDKLFDVSILDGCYVIKTNVPESIASKEEIHDRYKDLKYVESAFRTMKTLLLKIRPLYHTNAKRTRGHVFVVMLAYMVAKHLREKWKNINATVDEGVKELVAICAMTVDVAGVKIDTVPEPRPLGKELLQALDIKLPKTFHSKGIKVATRKKI